jgi:putative sugar O-methyltransferase
VRDLEVYPETPVAFSTGSAFTDDTELVSRILSAYKYAVSAFDGHGDSMWADIARRSDGLHSELLKGQIDAVAGQLRYPVTNDLLLGFDETNKTHYSAHKARDKPAREAWGRLIHYRLIRLAEALSAIRVWYPESPHLDLNSRDISIEFLFKALDEKFGFEVDFPNPYPGEFGLKTTRGIVDHRALFAIYQAWRLSTFASKNGRTRVLEIGAGTGRTAYYARKFGLFDYTIVDLPLANVAQANFLGRLLDPSLLVLSNEEDDASRYDRIRIFGPRWFSESSERFDVVLNADSLTEIDRTQAAAYFMTIARRADVFVSINHEVNSFRVCDLPLLAGIPTRFSKYPFWLRDGYVEELFFFRQRAQSELDNRIEFERFGRTILDQQIQIKKQAQELRSRRALVRRLAKLMIQRARARLRMVLATPPASVS